MHAPGFTRVLRRLLATAAFVLTALLTTHAQQWEWAVQTNETSDVRSVASVADPQANVYIAGWFSGTATFGTTTLTASGSNDAFIAKLDLAGNWLWVVQAGSDAGPTAPPFNLTVREGISGLALDAAGNVYVHGFFADTATFGTSTLTTIPAVASSCFVGSLTPAGQWRWASAPTTRNTPDAVNGQIVSRHLAVDPVSGAVYITGMLSGDYEFGATHVNFPNPFFSGYVAKLSPGGQWEWIRTPASSSMNTITSVAVDGAGQPYVMGDYGGTTTFGSTILTGGSDSFVAGLTATGQWRWALQLDAVGMGSMYARELKMSPQGTLYGVLTSNPGGVRVNGLILRTNGNRDATLVRLDTAGALLDVLMVGGPNDDDAQGIDVDAAGNAYVSGAFRGTAQVGNTSISSAGGKDAFVAFYSRTQNQWGWAVSGGGGADETAFAVAVGQTSTGPRIFTTGQFASASFSFGATPAIVSTGAGQYTGPLFTAAYHPSPATGLSHAAEAELRLSPNPATTSVRLALPAIAPVSRSVQLLNAVGRAVREFTIPAYQQELALDLAGLPPGLYVVRAGLTSRRLIVE